jgi:YegS/Rv2252/BmrU family lipid kinase
VNAIFIVNPAAHGGKSVKVWSGLDRILASRGLPRDAIFTQAPLHATEIARAAAGEGAKKVFAVGGDGTVQEVANGLVGSRSVLAPIPAGRGNDFVRALGLPANPVRALEAGMNGSSRQIDLGWVEASSGRRYFVTIASVGFDAEVAQEVARGAKRLGGTLTYLAGLVKTLARYQAYQIELGLEDQLPVKTTALFVAVGNTPYYAGGMRMVPGARPDDGILDLCLCGGLTRFETVKSLPLVYLGIHGRHPKVSFMKTTQVTVSSNQPLTVQADGEVVGRCPVSFGVAPSVLRVASTGHGPQ